MLLFLVSALNLHVQLGMNACYILVYYACTIIICTSRQYVCTGPPSPPEPVITAVNSTLLHVSWPPPFTWTNHSITHYNITLTNTNEGTSFRWHSNEMSFPWSGVGGCDVLVVNVTLVAISGRDMSDKS